MKRAEPGTLGGHKKPNSLHILWDAGEPFDIALSTRSKLQPRTLITYFPALGHPTNAQRPMAIVF